MDISKLPRLSQTPSAPAGGGGQAPSPGDPDAFCTHCGGRLDPQVRFCPHCGAPAGRGAAAIGTRDGAVADSAAAADLWIALVLGIIFMFLGGNFAKYLLVISSGQPHHTGVNWIAGERAGQEVGYWQLQGSTAFSESALFLFGAALILAAAMNVISRLVGRAASVASMAGSAVLILAVAYNFFVVIRLLREGISPLMSILAVGLGGYLLLMRWSLRTRQRAAA